MRQVETTATKVPCPVHALINQICLLTEMFGLHRVAQLPLFPTSEGTVVTKDNFVKWVQSLARECGLSSEHNIFADFGGHVWRVSGSRHMYRMGIPINIIKLLARWSSIVVDHYLKDTPLEQLTDLYRSGASVSGTTSAAQGAGQLALCTSAEAAKYTLEAVPPKHTPTVSRKNVKDLIESALRPLETQLVTISNMVTNVECDVVRCKDDIDVLRNRQTPPFVMALQGRKGYHVTSGDYNLLHPTRWQTRCGWAYSACLFERHAEIPIGTSSSRLCKRCLPVQAQQSVGVIAGPSDDEGIDETDIDQ